ncbi:MAG: hypothetical protein SPI59_03340 [Finegoldia sp.]|nr:hypothetical protein [Finegoldia sp.]
MIIKESAYDKLLGDLNNLLSGNFSMQKLDEGYFSLKDDKLLIK